MTDIFENDGLRFAFRDEGPKDAPAVLLLHGFASNMRVNWVGSGWFDTLGQAGYRVLAFDHRGHGDSDKPHDASFYTPSLMASDASALLRRQGIEKAAVFGYSMGARVSAFMALDDPQHVAALIFGGLGIGMIDGVGDWDPIADALLAPSIDDVSHARGRTFRSFADRTRSDRKALAACIATSRRQVSPAQAGAITQPTLIAVGTLDEIAGEPEPLAKLMPNARAFAIEGRDHMLAVGDHTFKAEVLRFLDQHRDLF